jgi:cobalt/nickel transport system permease protein
MVQQLATLTGSLLIRSYERSERVYKAMRLRGYGYGVPSRPLCGRPEPAATMCGVWGLAAGVLAVAAGFVIAEIGLSVL